jgi:hypothetical protein
VEVLTRVEGSCACGVIRFSATSPGPYPYRICYCRRCRKLAGGVGAAINILADGASLKITGAGSLASYQHGDDGPITKFCSHCGSALLVELPAWQQWLYPFASAIDTPLPDPPHHIHIQLRERATWVPPIGSADDPRFDDNTDESIIEWHQRLGLCPARSPEHRVDLEAGSALEHE